MKMTPLLGATVQAEAATSKIIRKPGTSGATFDMLHMIPIYLFLLTYKPSQFDMFMHSLSWII